MSKAYAQVSGAHGFNKEIKNEKDKRKLQI
jgi:hypothetical protein